jgi:DNA-binding PadR family transcriptional regulator
MALRHALLTLLADERLSGYDLVQYFDGSVGFVWHATHPQIYRELEKLRQEKLLSGRLVRQTGRPNKKVYSLTAKGRRELLEWAASPPPPRRVKDGTFLRAFSYGRIDPAVARARLAEHQTGHAERLAHYRKLAEMVSQLPDDARRTGALLTLQAGIFVEEAYLRWGKWACEFFDDLQRQRPARRRRRTRPEAVQRAILREAAAARRSPRRS